MVEEEEELPTNIVVYDDDSDEDSFPIEVNEVCAACGGDEQKQNANAWIGCLKCPRWFHKYCLNGQYENMTLAEIRKLDFMCEYCSKLESKKAKRKLNM